MKLFQLCLTALTLMTSLVVALPNILALPRRIRDTTNSTTTSSPNARYVFAHFIVRPLTVDNEDILMRYRSASQRIDKVLLIGMPI